MKKLIFAFALITTMFVTANNGNSVLESSKKEFVTKSNLNAFCRLIQMGQYNAVKILVEDGIDIEKKSIGLTPLMFAARHNRVDIVNLLIKHGANLNVKSSDRRKITAMKWAEITNAKESYVVLKKAMRKIEVGKLKRVMN